MAQILSSSVADAIEILDMSQNFLGTAKGQPNRKRFQKDT